MTTGTDRRAARGRRSFGTSRPSSRWSSSGIVTSDPERGRIVTTQLLVVAPLFVRRLWPTAVFVLVGVLAAATSMESPTPLIQAGAVALASYTTGDLNRDRIRAAVLVLVVAASISAALLIQDASALQAVVFPFVVVVPAWLLGDIVRQRRLEAIARSEAGERALRDAEERVRAAVAEERRTMARELHDVVAHGVSVMLIQAGAARQVVATVAGVGHGSPADGRGDGPGGDVRASAAARRARRRGRGGRRRATTRP